MGSIQQFTFIGILIYFIILALIIYFSSRKENKDDYLIGNRKVGILGTVASLASGFRDGAGIAVWITLAIFFGFGALWLTVGMSLALFLLAVFAPKIREIAYKRKYITVGDYFKDSFGNKTALISSLIITIGALLISAAQLFVSGTIFSTLLGVPSNIVIFLIAGIIAVYLMIGGYKTVIKTDIFQWGIIMLFAITPFLLKETAITNISLNTLLSPGLNNIIGFIAISFLIVFSGADVWQRMFSSSSSKNAKKSLLLTIPTYLLISIGLIIFGYGIKSFVGDATDPFFAFFTSTASPILISLFGLFIAVSIMSTIDTQIFLASSTIIKNIFPNKNEIYISRIIIPIALIVLSFLAISDGSIIEFVFGAYTSLTVLFPLFLLASFTNKNRKLDIGLSTVIISSFTIYILLFSFGYFENILYTLIPGIVSLSLGLMVFYIFRERAPQKE